MRSKRRHACVLSNAAVVVVNLACALVKNHLGSWQLSNLESSNVITNRMRSCDENWCKAEVLVISCDDVRVWHTVNILEFGHGYVPLPRNTKDPLPLQSGIVLEQRAEANGIPNFGLLPWKSGKRLVKNNNLT